MARNDRPQRTASESISRRDLLRQGGLAALGLTLVSSSFAPLLGEEKTPGKKGSILYFTKCSGFEHDPVKRKGDQPSFSAKVFMELGKKHDFEVLESKDGRIFDSRDLDGFDVIAFYTSGMLTEAGGDKQPPMSAAGKKRLLDTVAGGKGFIGIHSATDSFHTPGPGSENQETPDPYIAMLGGEFISHGRQQKAKMTVASPGFPGCEGLGGSFELLEEWYALKNFARDLHVILVQETAGMVDWQYQRPPFPATWARLHGKGRVFHTSLGHRDDVWTSDLFQKVFLGGVAWTLRRVDAEVPANIEKVTPKAWELAKEKK